MLYINQTTKITGFVIFPKDETEVPECIVFIPVRSDTLLTLDAESVETALQQNDFVAYFSYFQNIKWLQPGIISTLENGKVIVGNINCSLLNFNDANIQYGQLTFEPNPVILDREVNDSAVINCNGRSIRFKVVEHQKRIGDVVQYEPLIFK
ncbi:hypothetical protein LX64_04181 [Chitinophaga skermanii]|uniref:Uncharacterized protein n=2 Tax=Chitinophaga skermanii TaxID=331697 RepID=A0A327Q963_9BACT|nr:hypothetical protein LX64_04181 [Chitinophaga skermanii]